MTCRKEEQIGKIRAKLATHGVQAIEKDIELTQSIHIGRVCSNLNEVKKTSEPCHRCDCPTRKAN